MACYLIYRQERKELFPLDDNKGGLFIYCGSAGDAVRISKELFGSFGLIGLLKIMAKLVTPSRSFYCIVLDNLIISYGYISFSFCRYYDVEKNAVVIGPVNTSPEFRSKGLAAFALRKAMNVLIEKGYSMFYIDTYEGNKAMRNVIAKCKFGEPYNNFNKNKP